MAESRGVPGTQPPPVPSASLIAKIQAEQQAALAAQRLEAQQRVQQMHGIATEPQQPQASPFGSQAARSQRVAARQPAPEAPRQEVPSPIPGMTAQEVFAGNNVQKMQNKQQGNQFAQFSQQAPPDKPRVPWYPLRGAGVDIELADVIVSCVPAAGIPGENDAQAKVVLSLFSEILSLREQVEELQNGGGGGGGAEVANLTMRVAAMERAMYEQRMGMSARARGVREQIEMFTAKGMSAEDIVAALQEQSDMAAKAAVSEPAGDG